MIVVLSTSYLCFQMFFSLFFAALEMQLPAVLQIRHLTCSVFKNDFQDFSANHNFLGTSAPGPCSKMLTLMFPSDFLKLRWNYFYISRLKGLIQRQITPKSHGSGSCCSLTACTLLTVAATEIWKRSINGYELLRV